MPDLGRSVRRLARRVAGVRDAAAVDPGVPGAATGSRAVAVTESLVADAAGLGGTWPADGAHRAFHHEVHRGEANLLERPLEATGGPGPRAALSAAAGMALSGLRATAFLSAPDLEANLDLLADAAGRQLPLVVHVAQRDGGRSAGTGHRAWHAAATTGAVLLHAATVQEAVDLALVARRVAEDALVPVLVGMDAEIATGIGDLHLPTRATVRRFLGSPDDTVHAASPSQEMLLGRHRRRLPRWHDPSRPLTGGALREPSSSLAAAAARRAYLDPHVAQALERAFRELAELTGRPLGSLALHRADGARVLLVTTGSTGPTLRAVLDATAGGLLGELLGGRKVGLASLAALRPLPAPALAGAARGTDLVVVLERSDAPLDGDGLLTREVRSALAHLVPRQRPEVATVVHGLGGAPVRAADLAGLVRRATGESRELLGGPRYLGVDLHPDVGPWPKRQVVLDALRRAYPDAARLGLGTGDAGGEAPLAAKLRPEGAFTTLFLRRGGAGREVASEAASLLHRLAGGRLAGREAPGWQGWGRPAADRLTWAPEAETPLADPGDGVKAEVAVWLGGTVPPDAGALSRLADGAALLVERPDSGWRQLPEPEVVKAAGDGRVKLYAVRAVAQESASLRRERLLGAFLGTLVAQDRLEVKMRRLVEVRRETLAGRGDLDPAGVEGHVSSLQAGFDRVHAVARGELLDATSTPTAAGADEARREVPASVRAAVEQGSRTATPGVGDRSAVPHRSGVDSLPRFWDQVAVPVQDGSGDGTTALLPDPHLATGALPPRTASLATTAGRREMLPAFHPAACTGCGDCWTVCPDGAVGPVVLSAADLVDRGLELAAAAGARVDPLRMATSKLAKNLGKELASAGSGTLGELLDAAWESTAAKMKLPEDRKEAAAEAFAAVRDALAPLPVVRTEPFGDEVFALAIDPDACKGCGLCVEACEPDALTAEADEPRRTRRARKLWELVEEMPAAAAETVEKARADADVGPLAGALLAEEARRVLSGGDADEAGSGESLAARQVLSAAAFHLAPRRRELLERIDGAAEELAAAIQGGLSRALPGRDLEALSRGLAGMDRPEAELADLTSRIETAFESDRVDVPRLRHLVDAARELADLRWRLVAGPVGGGRSLLSVVAGPGPAAAWCGAFPSAPFAVPVTVATAGDAAALARGVVAGQVEQAVEGVRALRRARLELEADSRFGSGPAAEARVEEALARIDQVGWRDLDADERRQVPPVFLVASEDALLESSLPGLLSLLAEDLPVKVLLLAEAHLGTGPGLARDLSETLSADAVNPATGGGRPSGGLGLDAGLLAAGAGWFLPGSAFVAQSSLAHGDHLEGAVAAALAHDGPALVRVHAPSPGRHGFAPGATVERARQAVRSRVFPLFVSRPAGAGHGVRLLDLSGNPDPGDALPDRTPAHWALGEGRYAAAFRPYREKDGEAVPLADYLALAAGDRDGKVPVLDRDGDGPRLRVTAPLVAATEARLAAWRSLQALAAGSLPTAETGDEAEAPVVVDAAELEALRTDHRAELDALRHDYEQRLSALRDEIQVELAQKVRGKLMAMALRHRNGEEAGSGPAGAEPPGSQAPTNPEAPIQETP